MQSKNICYVVICCIRTLLVVTINFLSTLLKFQFTALHTASAEHDIFGKNLLQDPISFHTLPCRAACQVGY